MGSLLFCIFTDRLSKKLKSSLNLWYLDDAMVGGDPWEVLKDFQKVSEECAMVHRRDSGKVRVVPLRRQCTGKK